MGKHRNSRQDAIFVEFMEAHPDISRGAVVGDRRRADDLWKDLADKLNEVGPPIKDVSGWKKVWFDWKCNIGRKFEHNKSLSSPGNEAKYLHPVSACEDAIARITGIGTETVGAKESASAKAQKRRSTQGTPSSDVKSTGEPAKLFLNSIREKRTETKIEEQLAAQQKSLSKISDQMNLCLETLRDNNSNLKSFSKYLERMCALKKLELQETRRHNLAVEMSLVKRVEIKRRRLKIEEIKFKLGVDDDDDEVDID